MVRGKGTGFVKNEAFEEDVVIEREALGFALNGDIVEVELKKAIPGKRQEGKVVRVVKAMHRELIGVVKEKTEGGQTVKFLSSKRPARPSTLVR